MPVRSAAVMVRFVAVDAYLLSISVVLNSIIFVNTPFYYFLYQECFYFFYLFSLSVFFSSSDSGLVN